MNVCLWIKTTLFFLFCMDFIRNLGKSKSYPQNYKEEKIDKKQKVDKLSTENCHFPWF